MVTNEKKIHSSKMNTNYLIMVIVFISIILGLLMNAAEIMIIAFFMGLFSSIRCMYFNYMGTNIKSIVLTGIVKLVWSIALLLLCIIMLNLPVASVAFMILLYVSVFTVVEAYHKTV